MGDNTFKSSASQVVDTLEDCHRGKACDGFMISAPVIPHGPERFVDLVIPELQRRGLSGVRPRSEHFAATFAELPMAGEYIHRTAFDIAATYGKDMFLAIHYLGTDRLPRLFAAKAWFDGAMRHVRFLPTRLSDRLMQGISRLFPAHLPRRLMGYRDRFEHHLILKMANDGIAEARTD